MAAQQPTILASQNLRVRKRRHISGLSLLHPQTLLFLVIALMVLFTLVPPSIYVRAINEPDLMFLNPMVYAFLVACGAVVWFGMRVGFSVHHLAVPRIKGVIKVPTFFYLLLPVVVALMLIALTITTILHNNPAIVVLALKGEGQLVKNALYEAIHGAFTGSLPLAMGVLWWVWASYLEFSLHVRRVHKYVLFFIVLSLFIGLLLSSYIMMSRNIIMPTLFGLFVIYMRFSVLEKGAKIFTLFLRGIFTMVLVLILFAVFSSLRTTGTQSAILTSFIGYGPASVNHLAGLLDDRFPIGMLNNSLQEANFGFIYQFPFVARIFHLGHILVANEMVYFRATADAGLNGSYIWFTAWGQVFADLGWLTPLYLFFYGFISARFWRSFIAGSVSGILLYPWFGFNILFTFGSNYAASNFLSILVLLSILLFFYRGFVRINLDKMAFN